MRPRAKALLCVAAVAALASCAARYPAREATLPAADLSAERVGEGKRLTLLMCGPCHYDPATRKLTGVRMLDLPAFVGEVYGRNITAHPERGIGRYTDGELAYLLRTGVARDGTLMPYMQKPHLADEDFRAVLAFLRSDDELVALSEVEPPPTRYSLLGKLGLRLVVKPVPYAGEPVSKPAPGDELALGRYLSVNLGCYECHSAGFTTNDPRMPERSKGYMGGGNKLRDAAGRAVYAPNLTTHETGLAAWDERDFVRALKAGVGRDGSVLGFPMPLYAGLEDREAAAIFKYLRTLPPIDRTVKRSQAADRHAEAPDEAGPGTALLADGRRTYHMYGCVQCHGDGGVAIGDLRRAYARYTDAQLRAYIGDAPSFGNPRMPPFADLIPDAEYPALIAYVKHLGVEASKK